jgi:hypothetical protein
MTMDDLTRIEGWLTRLEKRAQEWLDAGDPETMEADKAAGHALKGIALITRMMELRKQFDPANNAGASEEIRQVIAALNDIGISKIEVVQEEQQQRDIDAEPCNE